MTQQKFQLRDELKVIPGIAIGLAVTFFVAIQVLWNVFVARDHNPPPMALRVFIGLAMGVMVALVIMLYGYVYRDAKRRSMNPLLWLLVVLLVPNALGFIVYFLMRQPLNEQCPQCGATVKSGSNFCPKCSFAFAPVCPQCRHGISHGDLYCPHCGTQLMARA